MSLLYCLRGALFIVLISVVFPAGADEAAAHCRYLNPFSLKLDETVPTPKLKGEVNGKPAIFALSTMMHASWMPRTTAEKLQLPLKHTALTTFGFGGESEVYDAVIDHAIMGDLEWHRQTLRVIYDNSRAISESDIMVGADVLFNERYDVEFNLAQHEVKFFFPNNCHDSFLAYWDENASVVRTSEIIPDFRTQYFMVKVNGKSFRASIDSSSEKTIMNLAAAKEIGFDSNAANVVNLGTAGGVGKHEQTIWLAPFSSFEIGDETIKNPKFEVSDFFGNAQFDSHYMLPAEFLGDKPQILLGADFLRSHRLLFALSQQKLYVSYVGGPVFGPYDGDKK